MAEITEVTISIVNLILSLICAFETLLIFRIITEKQFRQNLRKTTISIMEFLNAWRLMLLAVVFYCVIQIYYLLVKLGAKEVPLLYELFGTSFLSLLVVGLYRYYAELKRIRESLIEE